MKAWILTAWLAAALFAWAGETPRAIPVDVLPTWEESIEVIDSPLDVAAVKALTTRNVSLGSVTALVVVVLWWYRKFRNK
jgi:hypothetical protein